MLIEASAPLAIRKLKLATRMNENLNDRVGAYAELDRPQNGVCCKSLRNQPKCGSNFSKIQARPCPHSRAFFIARLFKLTTTDFCQHLAQAVSAVLARHVVAFVRQGEREPTVLRDRLLHESSSVACAGGKRRLLRPVSVQTRAPPAHRRRDGKVDRSTSGFAYGSAPLIRYNSSQSATPVARMIATGARLRSSVNIRGKTPRTSQFCSSQSPQRPFLSLRSFPGDVFGRRVQPSLCQSL